jgi:nucleoid DNA-binding protein
VNIHGSQSQLASAVAAKAGIAPKQAATILCHLIDLPNADIRTNIEISNLGNISLSNAPAKFPRRSAFSVEKEIPYEATAKFKVGDKFKKLVLQGTETAKRNPTKFDEWGGKIETLLTSGGLEGDDTVIIRIPEPKKPPPSKPGGRRKRRSRSA